MRLHVTADWHVHRSSSRNSDLRRKLDLLRGQMSPDDWLVVLGDVTDNGLEAEYEEAREMLALFTGRVFLVEGNHDCGWLGLLVLNAARRRWDKLVKAVRSPATLETEHLLLAVVDSCKYSCWPGDTARGRVGSKQRDRIVRQWLPQAQAAGKKLVLCLHHWPFTMDPTMLLEDAEDVLRLTAGKADLWAGHMHSTTVVVRPGSEARLFSDFRHSGSVAMEG